MDAITSTSPYVCRACLHPSHIHHLEKGCRLENAQSMEKEARSVHYRLSIKTEDCEVYIRSLRIPQDADDIPAVARSVVAACQTLRGRRGWCQLPSRTVVNVQLRCNEVWTHASSGSLARRSCCLGLGDVLRFPRLGIGRMQGEELGPPWEIETRHEECWAVHLKPLFASLCSILWRSLRRIVFYIRQ